MDVNEELQFSEKIKKKNLGGGRRGGGRVGGVRMGVNEELKFFCENSKKKNVGGRVEGVRVDVNEKLKFL